MRNQMTIQPVLSNAFPKIVPAPGRGSLFNFKPQRAWKVTYRGMTTMFHKRAELNLYIRMKPLAVPVWYFGDIPTD